MRKPVRIIGTTVAAAAIVGVTGAAASAHDGYDHGGFGGYGHGGFGGYGHHSFGAHGSFDGHGFAAHGSFDRHGFGAHGSFDHHSWGYRSDDLGDDPGDDPGDDSQGDGSVAPGYDPGSFGDDREDTDEGTNAAPSYQAPTFDQRKAAIVSALQAADARLTALQDRLTSAAAANDPTGFAPKALPYVAQARARVESLLAQVQSATTEQQLAEILQQAPGAPAPAPTPAV